MAVNTLSYRLEYHNLLQAQTALTWLATWVLTNATRINNNPNNGHSHSSMQAQPPETCDQVVYVWYQFDCPQSEYQTAYFAIDQALYQGTAIPWLQADCNSWSGDITNVPDE